MSDTAWITLATFRAAIDGLTDDGDSCRFYKRCQVMKNMTKRELIAVMEAIHKARYPALGCGWGHKMMRQPKMELMRWIDYSLERLERDR